MSGSLADSAASILRQYLVNESLATLPSDGGSWPASDELLMNNPDNVISVIDTAGITRGRIQYDGEQVTYPGVQVRIRGATKAIAWTKTNTIKESFDKDSYQYVVTIGGNEYEIHTIKRIGTPISLGTETPTSKRFSYTINVLLTVKQTS